VFGRETELSVLTSLLTDVSGGPVALLLEGDAGIGKTTLWKEGLAAARDRSYRVLACQPVESEAQFSFAALGDLLGGVLEEAEVSLAAPQARALDIALLRVEPEGVPPDGHAISLAILEIIRSLARQGPVVLGFDDIQWLDAPTARVLEFALRRLETEPVGIITTARSGDDHRVPFGLDRSWPEGGLRRMTVGSLSVEALWDVVRAELGEVFSRPTLVRLHQMSGGNPFFALEIARASVRGDRPATGELLPVPQSLRDTVRTRVRDLPSDVRTPFLVVSALSNPSVGMIESAAGAVAGEALAGGVEAGLIEIEGDRIRFTHPLYGSVIYSEASSADRRRVHRRLAEVTTDPEERARHLALGAEGPDPGTAAALDEAAELAWSRGAPDSAATLFEMARRLTPSDAPADARRRMLRASDANEQAGDTRRARDLLEEILAADPPGPARAEALQRLGMVVARDESWVHAGDLFRSALEEAGDDPRRVAPIEQGLGYAAYFEGRLDESESHARAALLASERVGDPALLSESLGALGLLEFVRGRGITPAMERARSLEPTAGIRMLVVRPTFVYAQALKYSGRYAEARRLFEGLLDEASGAGSEPPMAQFLYHLAELECWAGNMPVAVDHARRALTLSAQPFAALDRIVALYATALVEAHLGRAEPARAAATEGIRLAEETGVAIARVHLLAVLGFLELSLGDARAAHGHLGPVAEFRASMGVGAPGFLPMVPDEVESLIALGEVAEAASLLDEFSEQAVAHDDAWGNEGAARCRALLLAADGDVAGALGLLDAWVRDGVGSSRPLERARTLLVMGQLQRRAKLKAPARETLEDALHQFRGLQASAWAERTAGELRRLGGRAPAPLALTPTEERVAELVTEGRTNREIAEALFVSVNTVEWHLSRIYRKLGVRSRSELIASAPRDPG
jgi:DNA-binding CsgD family transcriptional regulator